MMIIKSLNDLRNAFTEFTKSFQKDLIYKLIFEIYDEKSREQEKKYHAMLGDIAKQAQHLNQTFDADDWKRLCVDMYRKDCIRNNVDRLADYWKKQNFRLVPALDGSGMVTLGAQTKKFPQYVASGFIEWLYHYGAENEIVWTDPQYQDEYERFV